MELSHALATEEWRHPKDIEQPIILQKITINSQVLLGFIHCPSYLLRHVFQLYL